MGHGFEAERRLCEPVPGNRINGPIRTSPAARGLLLEMDGGIRFPLGRADATSAATPKWLTPASAKQRFG
jgi:hypothetical protein